MLVAVKDNHRIDVSFDRRDSIVEVYLRPAGTNSLGKSLDSLLDLYRGDPSHVGLQVNSDEELRARLQYLARVLRSHHIEIVDFFRTASAGGDLHS
jgi:hypothetical protein